MTVAMGYGMQGQGQSPHRVVVFVLLVVLLSAPSSRHSFALAWSLGWG